MRRRWRSGAQDPRPAKKTGRTRTNGGKPSTFSPDAPSLRCRRSARPERCLPFRRCPASLWPVLQAGGSAFDRKSLRGRSSRSRTRSAGQARHRRSSQTEPPTHAPKRPAIQPRTRPPTQPRTEPRTEPVGRFGRSHRNPESKKSLGSARGECARDKSVAIHVTSEYPLGVARDVPVERVARAIDDCLGFPTPLSSPLQQASEVVLSLQHVFEPSPSVPPAGSTVPRSELRA